MQQARQISLIIALLLWGILIGGIAYAHIVYLPAYLHHLPESNNLITPVYGIHEEYFWMSIHPPTLLLTILTLALNWKIKPRRKFIGLSLGIYMAVLVVTFLYFVPELKAFAAADSSVTVAEWNQRGLKWEQLSWIRGCFVYAGFIFLLLALAKNNRPGTRD